MKLLQSYLIVSAWSMSGFESICASDIKQEHGYAPLIKFVNKTDKPVIVWIDRAIYYVRDNNSYFCSYASSSKRTVWPKYSYKMRAYSPEWVPYQKDVSSEKDIASEPTIKQVSAVPQFGLAVIFCDADGTSLSYGLYTTIEKNRKLHFVLTYDECNDAQLSQQP